jgi:hypothetical protein
VYEHFRDFLIIIARFLSGNLSCWVLVINACNPSYLGDRDQEDCGLKPMQAK